MRTLEIDLINCKINPFLTRSVTCVITNSTGAGIFAVTDTKIYFPVIALMTKDNVKLVDQLKSDFKRTINWNNNQSKVSIERQN